jgi:hypothetical protein
MSKRLRPYEWWGLFIAIIAYDIFVYKTQRRPTLTSVVKGLRKDKLTRSILWAFWLWLTYHWLLETDD